MTKASSKTLKGKIIKLNPPLAVNNPDFLESNPTELKALYKGHGFDGLSPREIRKAKRYSAMVALAFQGSISSFTTEVDGTGLTYRLRNKDVRQVINDLKTAQKKKFVETYESIGNGLLQSKDWIKSKKKATAKATPNKAEYLGAKILELFSEDKVAEIEKSLGINFSTDV